MILNVILAFVIPWIVCMFHIFKRDAKLVVTIGPFSSVVAFTVAEIGEYFGFWLLYPFNKGILSVLPFNFGIYPVLGIYLIYFIKKYRSPYLIILLMTLLTTIGEGIWLLLGMVLYQNNWNIGWTFISYLFPFIFIYLYYLFLKRLKILD